MHRLILIETERKTLTSILRTEIVPREGEFVSHKNRLYKVNKIVHHFGDAGYHDTTCIHVTLTN